MIWFQLTYVVFLCPGGWFSGLMPKAAKPFVCEKSYKHEPYTRLADAQDKFQSLGQDASPGITQMGPGLRMKELPGAWTQTAKF